MRRAVSSSIAASLILITGAVCAHAYDASWHRSESWGGEYPHGFTLTKDVTIKLRGKLDRDALRQVVCALKKGATYHLWNAKRVASSKLEFVTYTQTVVYLTTAAITIDAEDTGAEKLMKLSLAKGDEWTYMTDYAEGMFEMVFKGKTYSAGQELFDVSTEKDGKPDQDLRPDEWMKLTRANGASGWLLLSDTNGLSGFDGPEIVEYGEASDKPN